MIIMGLSRLWQVFLEMCPVILIASPCPGPDVPSPPRVRSGISFLFNPCFDLELSIDLACPSCTRNFFKKPRRLDGSDPDRPIVLIPFDLTATGASQHVSRCVACWRQTCWDYFYEVSWSGSTDIQCSLRNTSNRFAICISTRRHFLF